MVNYSTEGADGCLGLCYDPCGCKAFANGACEYHVVSETCTVRELECPVELFANDWCLRKGVFYASGGVVCFNKNPRGNCTILKNVLSVNANGRRHKDRYGIQYLADFEVPFRDDYGGREKFYFSNSRLQHVDSYLYEGVVSAIGHGTDLKQCLTYEVPLAGDGMYELAIRTFEPYQKRVSRRVIIVFNHVLINISKLVRLLGNIVFVLSDV